jgi:hypothetical protein
MFTAKNAKAQRSSPKLFFAFSAFIAVKSRGGGGAFQLNAGITSLANRRIDFLISLWGIPPKLKVVVSVSK